MSDPARLEWNGDKILVTLKATAWENIARAAVFLWERLQDTLNVPNTGVSVPKRGGGTQTIYPHPSKPGEPPRKRTGWLQRHVLYELNQTGLWARVGLGANAKYGVFLEMGTARMKARPWLLSTVEKNMDALKAIAGGKGA